MNMHRVFPHFLSKRRILWFGPVTAAIVFVVAAVAFGGMNKVDVAGVSVVGTGGTWTNVTPAGVNLGNGTGNLGCGNYGVSNVTVDPVRPSDYYTNFYCQGVWKSTDYGQSWAGPINTGTNGAEAGDCAGGFVAAPGTGTNPVVLYQGCIRGSAIGFMRSLDGGVSWTKFNIAPAPAGRQDAYPPVVDPYDSNHLLMDGHELNTLYQSVDGGQTWTNVPLAGGMNTNGGTAFTFFVDTGNAASTRGTWLYTPQAEGTGVGTWRTTNNGASWVRVDGNEHPHGAMQNYQPNAGGVVYMAGVYSSLGWGVLRSADYGQTWAHVAAAGNQTTVFGTPNFVYSDYGISGQAPSKQAATQPGATGWASMTAPAGMTTGAASAAHSYNGTSYVIVTANWGAGLWRYVEASSGPSPTNTPAPAATPVPTPTSGTVVHTCTTILTLNGTPTRYTRQLPQCANQ